MWRSWPAFEGMELHGFVPREKREREIGESEWEVYARHVVSISCRGLLAARFRVAQNGGYAQRTATVAEHPLPPAHSENNSFPEVSCSA